MAKINKNTESTNTVYEMSRDEVAFVSPETKELDQSKAGNQSAGVILEPEKVKNKIYKKYYLNWLNLKEQMFLFRNECVQKSESLSDSSKKKLEIKFNERALKLNKIAGELKLASKFLEKPLILTNSVILDEVVGIKNEQQILSNAVNEVLKGTKNTTSDTIRETINSNLSNNSLGEATSVFGGDPSTSVDAKIEDLHDSLSKATEDKVKKMDNKPSLSMPNFGSLDNASNTPVNNNIVSDEPSATFVIPTTVVHGASKEQREAENKALMASAIKMEFDQLSVTSEPANANLKFIYDDKGYDVNTKSVDTQISGPNPPSAPIEMMPDTSKESPSLTPVFGPPTSSGKSESLGNVEVKAPETFVIPTTEVHGASKEQREAENKALMASAIKMEFDQLSVTSEPANASLDVIYADKGLDVDTKVNNPQQPKSPVPQNTDAIEPIAGPPAFNSENNNDEDVIPETFVIPTTEVHGASKEQREAENKVLLASAIKMEFDQLSVTSEPANVSLDVIYADKGLDVDTKVNNPQQPKSPVPQNTDEPMSNIKPPSFSQTLNAENNNEKFDVSNRPEMPKAERPAVENNEPISNRPEMPKAERPEGSKRNDKQESSDGTPPPILISPESFNNSSSSHFNSTADAVTQDLVKLSKDIEDLKTLPSSQNTIQSLNAGNDMTAIEKRFVKLEEMVQNLVANQSNIMQQERHTGITQEFTGLQNEFEKINKKLNQIEEEVKTDHSSGLFSSLTKGYKYNNKK